MNREHEQLVIDFYDARRRNDQSAIRSFLADDVLWHEPKVSDATGDLQGAGAVLRMMSQARALTGGTFSLAAEGVLANESHAVALINWSAKKGERHLEGSEFAVFRIEGMKIEEVWFYQQDLRTDKAFWTDDETPA